jgi:hypothetical protein
LEECKLKATRINDSALGARGGMYIVLNHPNLASSEGAIIKHSGVASPEIAVTIVIKTINIELLWGRSAA